MSLKPLKWFIAASLVGVFLFQFPYHADEPILSNKLEMKVGDAVDKPLANPSIQPARTQSASVTQSAERSSAPSSSFQVKPSVLYPGDVLFIESSKKASVTLWNQTYTLKPSGDKYVRFIPIPLEVKPGPYSIESTDHKMKAQIQIQEKTFPFDAITVTKQMESMKSNTKRIASDQKKINQARSKSSATPYFTGKFMLPAEGKLTTPYGYRRVVNNKPDNPHLAIDLANKTGTPIVAAESGQVVLADAMYLNGNMIILDHGLNVFATYSHLSQIDVKPGQLVHKGQVIGKIGTTGFSTGPHLHYAMLIGNTFVNPNVFIHTAFVP